MIKQKPKNRIDSDFKAFKQASDPDFDEAYWFAIWDESTLEIVTHTPEDKPIEVTVPCNHPKFPKTMDGVLVPVSEGWNEFLNELENEGVSLPE